MTSCRFDNWSSECEQAVNKQINVEYWASYQYHLMFSHFDKDTVGLNNIANFFNKSSLEERDHAHNLIKYQNLRGGDVKFYNVSDINLDYLNNKKSNDLLLSFMKALEMEQKVYKSLLNLHSIGDKHKDPQFTDFSESEYLEEQIKALNEISKYIAQLKLIGSNTHGQWNFDKQFQ